MPDPLSVLIAKRDGILGDIGREVDRLLSRLLPDNRQQNLPVDLEATEMAVRSSMHQVGGDTAVIGSTAATAIRPRS